MMVVVMLSGKIKFEEWKCLVKEILTVMSKNEPDKQ